MAKGLTVAQAAKNMGDRYKVVVLGEHTMMSTSEEIPLSGVVASDLAIANWSAWDGTGDDQSLTAACTAGTLTLACTNADDQDGVITYMVIRPL